MTGLDELTIKAVLGMMVPASARVSGWESSRRDGGGPLQALYQIGGGAPAKRPQRKTKAAINKDYRLRRRPKPVIADIVRSITHYPMSIAA